MTFVGFKKEGGVISVVSSDGRTVMTSSGKLINLLPLGTKGFEDTVSVSWPDFNKDYLYRWAYKAVNTQTHGYNWDSYGNVAISAPKQDYSNTTILRSVPPLCDIAWGFIKLHRTTNPSHTWSGKTISVRPPTNVWIPLNGSIIVEAADVMLRTLSIYIKDNGDGTKDLVLEKEQSVGPPPGAINDFGDGNGDVAVPPAAPSATSTDGGDWDYGSAKGIPVYAPSSSSYNKHSFGTVDSFGGPILLVDEDHCKKHRWSGSSPCSHSDPTNYSSTYSIDLKIFVGRRS